MTGFSSPINLGLAQTPDPNLPGDVFTELIKVYSAIAVLHQKVVEFGGLGTLDPTNFLSINDLPANTFQVGRMTAMIVQATEDISAGHFVNLHNSGGIKVRKANATAIATRADGYAPYAIANGNKGIVELFVGYLPGGGGLTVASTYYLSAATPGGITLTAPVTVGNIRQEVGRSGSADDLFVRISTPIVL